MNLNCTRLHVLFMRTTLTTIYEQGNLHSLHTSHRREAKATSVCRVSNTSRVFGLPGEFRSALAPQNLQTSFTFGLQWFGWRYRSLVSICIPRKGGVVFGMHLSYSMALPQTEDSKAASSRPPPSTPSSSVPEKRRGSSECPPALCAFTGAKKTTTSS